MMGKRDHIKRVFREFSKQTSASESVSTSFDTASAPRLDEPTDKNRSQDAQIRDLWSLALEKLSKEEKYEMSQLTLDSRLDILGHLHTAAIKKRTDCEDRRWKFKLNGREIILRNVAEKIIAWIDKFKQIGDIAVNFDPVHASLPWAGIRFLLEVGIDDSTNL